MDWGEMHKNKLWSRPPGSVYVYAAATFETVEADFARPACKLDRHPSFQKKKKKKKKKNERERTKKLAPWLLDRDYHSTTLEGFIAPCSSQRTLLTASHVGQVRSHGKRWLAGEKKKRKTEKKTIQLPRTLIAFSVRVNRFLWQKSDDFGE